MIWNNHLVKGDQPVSIPCLGYFNVDCNVYLKIANLRLSSKLKVLLSHAPVVEVVIQDNELYCLVLNTSLCLTVSQVSCFLPECRIESDVRLYIISRRSFAFEKTHFNVIEADQMSSMTSFDKL